MTCPHCNSPLSFIAIDTIDGQSQTIDECLSCGGHFLPPYMANFLSVDTAKNVDSVPGNVTVFTCPNNHGDFFPKGQFLSFKKAQQAKIYYHKLWGIPLKSAFAVIIPLVIVVTAVSIMPTLIKQLGLSQESRIKASDILTAPLITPISGTQILISFSTKSPAIASVHFTQGHEAFVDKVFTISQTPQTNHLLNIDSLTSGTLYKYVITLDVKGKITTTDEYTFATP